MKYNMNHELLNFINIFRADILKSNMQYENKRDKNYAVYDSYVQFN